ncbi:MAG: ABC transporter permease [Firmicutes bacterium]|nr:ABC transporter permease [Bacillota bacterium]
MNSVVTIWRRELSSLFRSPIAYVVIAAFLVLAGYIFSIALFSTQLADMTILFGNLAVTFLFVAPLLTMRTLSEERRLGTDEFLLTSPLTIPEIVIGKYLAVLTVWVLMLLMTGIYPIILNIIGDPEGGPIFAGYLGLFLLGASFLAVGIFASSLSENQIVAGVIAFGILLGLWLLTWIASALGGMLGRIIEGISLLGRFDTLLSGVLDTSDLLFYVSFVFLFLFFTIRTVDRRRLS